MQPTTITGVVTPFKGNGRKLGYPTANLKSTVELKDGVYFGFANMAKYEDHPALIFIGTPTTMGDKQRRVEAYLLDIPDQDYYGENLKLRVEQFHRANVTFKEVDSLLKAISNDELKAREWFDEFSTGSVRP